jgi:phage terminase large subunit GpA-like protein
MCKSELYGLLAKDRPAAGEPFPPGWVHFASDLDEEFFRQLTAEQIVVRVVKGYRKHEWIKTRERNEDLDCCNYARAAASVFGLDRFSEHRWIEMEQQFGTWRPKSQSFVARKEQDTPAALRSQSPAQVQRVVVGARRPDWFGNRGRNWL